MTVIFIIITAFVIFIGFLKIDCAVNRVNPQIVDAERKTGAKECPSRPFCVRLCFDRAELSGANVGNSRNKPINIAHCQSRYIDAARAGHIDAVLFAHGQNLISV